MSEKKRNPSQKKKFRINAKKLFLTYPKKCPKTKVELDRDAVFRALGVKLRSYGIETLVVGEEISEGNYEHFHAFVKLEKKVNITKEDTLDIEGVHGNYQSSKKEYDSIKYVTKDKSYISVGYKEMQLELKKFEDPFKAFCYVCKYKDFDPTELLKTAKLSKDFNLELFNIFTDYLKNSAKYENYIKSKSETVQKKYDHIWARKDVYDNILQWVEKSIEKAWCDTVLYLKGPAGTGKSSLAISIFDQKALTVRDLNQLKNYQEDKHNAIIFDDLNLKNKSREEVISLIDSDTNKVVDVKYSTKEISPSTLTLFIGNKNIQDYFNGGLIPVDSTDFAIMRRINQIDIDYKSSLSGKMAPPLIWKESDLNNYEGFEYISIDTIKNKFNLLVVKLSENIKSGQSCDDLLDLDSDRDKRIKILIQMRGITEESVDYSAITVVKLLSAELLSEIESNPSMMRLLKEVKEGDLYHISRIIELAAQNLEAELYKNLRIKEKRNQLKKHWIERMKESDEVLEETEKATFVQMEEFFHSGALFLKDQEDLRSGEPSPQA